jgi:tripartite-type tricarboxylate transporter receptor subunit TctC
MQSCARLLLCALMAMSATIVSAQPWPTAKPIRIVIAFGPGSASDIFARLVADRLRADLNQTVIVESKPGASGIIAAEFVAKAPADGYTLFLTTNTTHSANPYLFKTLPYDPLKDFTPIARIGYFPFVVLVDSKLPINSVKELVAHSKATPGGISYAYTSSAGQVAAAALSNLTGMNATGVPYKAAPQALADVVGGQVPFTVIDFATSQPLVKQGRLRALAVTPQARTSLAPELPTLREAAGLEDFGVVAWMGLFGPANLPPDIVEWLSADLVKIVTAKDMEERMVAMGTEPAPAGAKEFDAFVKSQLRVWERQIKIAGVKPE